MVGFEPAPFKCGSPSNASDHSVTRKMIGNTQNSLINFNIPFHHRHANTLCYSRQHYTLHNTYYSLTHTHYHTLTHTITHSITHTIIHTLNHSHTQSINHTTTHHSSPRVNPSTTVCFDKLRSVTRSHDESVRESVFHPVCLTLVHSMYLHAIPRAESSSH